jgi:hypothetical protein
MMVMSGQGQPRGFASCGGGGGGPCDRTNVGDIGVVALVATLQKREKGQRRLKIVKQPRFRELQLP